MTNSFGGTQDNGTQKYSGMLTWSEVVCCDGGWTAIDPSTPSTVYAVCCSGTSYVMKSTTTAGTCTAPALGATGTLSCKVGNLASAAKATVTMTVRDTAAAGSTLTDTGRASSTTPDPDTKNNSLTIKTGMD